MKKKCVSVIKTLNFTKEYQNDMIISLFLTVLLEGTRASQEQEDGSRVLGLFSARRIITTNLNLSFILVGASEESNYFDEVDGFELDDFFITRIKKGK